MFMVDVLVVLGYACCIVKCRVVLNPHVYDYFCSFFSTLHISFPMRSGGLVVCASEFGTLVVPMPEQEFNGFRTLVPSRLYESGKPYTNLIQLTDPMIWSLHRLKAVPPSRFTRAGVGHSSVFIQRIADRFVTN